MADTKTPTLDIEEARDAIVDSMAADDRQTSHQFDAGMKALNALVALAERALAERNPPEVAEEAGHCPIADSLERQSATEREGAQRLATAGNSSGYQGAALLAARAEALALAAIRVRSQVAAQSRELERLRADRGRQDSCWHCRDVLMTQEPRCERCPARGDCDDENCQADGCVEERAPKETT